MEGESKLKSISKKSITKAKNEKVPAYSPIKFIRQFTVTASYHQGAKHEFADDGALSCQRGVDEVVAHTHADIATD